MYPELPNPRNYSEEEVNHFYGGTESLSGVFIFGHTPRGQDWSVDLLSNEDSAIGPSGSSGSTRSLM